MTLQDVIYRVHKTLLGPGWSWVPRGELIVILFMAVGAVDFCTRVLGIRNLAIASVFAIVWLRPAITRLSDLRRGHYVPWNDCATRRFETAAMLIGSAAPWAILQLLHDADPSWVARQSVDLPIGVRICGAALAILVVAKQERRATTNHDVSPRARLSPNVTLKSQLLMVSMFLMSGSAFIGLLATGWALSALVAFARQRLTAVVQVLVDQPIS
jgi:hypothetical protein